MEREIVGDFQKIDKFEVTGKLGQGSFGVVYKGRDPFLKRDVAIKVCTVDDAGLRQRFFREAEIAGRLEHRNIVSVFALGFEGGVPFLVQEFLEGEDLRQALERGAPMTGVLRLDILLQVAEGLAYAHEQGVIHRDVKPANVRLVADGRVKVIDFGIAKLASDESQLTQKGVTMGTASYLPPEQVRGGETDHRADIFSFGVLAYELFTGERPFRGKTISALVYQILYKPPLPVTQLWPECPRELAELLSKCLEKQPDSRYPNLREVIARLAAIRDAGVAGRLPALHQVLAPKKKDHDATVSSDVLSQSMISRTAREVSGNDSGGPGRDVTELPTLEAPRSGGSELPTLPVAAARGRSAKDLDELPTLEAPKKAAPGQPVGTQRVPMMAPGAGSFTAAGPAAATPPPPAPSAAATQRMAMPVLPEGSDPVVEFDDLATSAHEISRLVAEGNLSGAMEQLEETMNRQRLPSPPVASAPGPTTVAPGVAAVDEWQPTTKIEVDPRLRQSTSAPPPPPPPAPPQIAPKMTPHMTPPPPLPEVRGVPLPPTNTPAAAPFLDASYGTSSTHGTSSTYGTGSTYGSSSGGSGAAAFPGSPPAAPAGSQQPQYQAAPQHPVPPHAAPPHSTPQQHPPPPLPSAAAPGKPARAAGRSKLPLLLGAGLVAFLLLAVGVFLALRKPTTAPEVPVVALPAPEPAPVGSTQLVIGAKPWGLVTEIVDAAGKSISVPAQSATPLLIPVASGGTFTVTVSRADSGEKGQCTVTVAEGAVAPCQVVFTDAGATANEFFKESGWWK